MTTNIPDMTFTEEDIMRILNIGVYDNDDMTPEQFDGIQQDRFTINNYSDSGYEYKNIYVFKIPDSNSKTGYSGMCLNKKYVERVKKAHESFKQS